METEDIFLNFSKPLKKPWFDKIKTELGEKYDQLLIENYSTSPIQHFDDRLIIKSNNENCKNATFICEEIYEKNNIEINETILNALEGGANSIKITISFLWSLKDFQEIFKGVYLNYIFIIFYFENNKINILDFLQIFKKYLNENEIKSASINGLIIVKNNEPISFKFKEFLGLKHTDIIKSVNTEPIQQLIDLLVFTENKLAIISNKKLQENFVNSIVFDLKLSNYFYKNIALINALKILWGNILKAYEIDYNIFISVTINTTSNPDKNIAIIEATNQALSAKIGGVDLLEITKFKHNQPEYSTSFSSRIARNIQNILDLESGINKVFDPTEGSYFIDNLTKNICEKVWSEFQKNTKKTKK